MAEMKEFYNNIGENYEPVYKRLLSSERIEKFLSHFFEENNISELKQQLSDNDRASALNTAHSLKGVISTLGINALVEMICGVHEALKNNESEKAETLCRQLLEKYDSVYKIWQDMHTTL